MIRDTYLVQTRNAVMGLMSVGSNASQDVAGCELLEQELGKKALIIASNRGPVSFQKDEGGYLESKRGRGGLVTALTGIGYLADTYWISCAQTDEDRKWRQGMIPIDGDDHAIEVHFLSPEPDAYKAYYDGIANPLLWFLQHSMLDIAHDLTITRKTWQDWRNGYVAVNDLFAEAIADRIHSTPKPSMVMLQDYHLYLTPRLLRNRLPARANYTLMHFIHIPWPGAEDWGLLPSKMRLSILDSLCAVDLLGFQTREDAMNFLRTCDSFLPHAYVKFNHGRIWYRNHMTYVMDFPISIDAKALKKLADSPEVSKIYQELWEEHTNRQLIVRVDRIEPSKNIVRGFQAFDELLEHHPEHEGKVQFLAVLVPSRMEMEKYKDTLAELMAEVGRINVKHGRSGWEPIRVLTGENYPRVVAAMQMYDVLLVNSLADGMNLVAKEGPIVNRCEGVLVLSERTGAHQQLQAGAISIPPLDISATAEAIHQALVMPLDEKRERAARLKQLIENQDIVNWLCLQVKAISDIGLE